MIKPVIELDLSALELAINSFTEGTPTDPFKVEAAKMFNVPESEVTPDQRRYAKTEAYYQIYGG